MKKAGDSSVASLPQNDIAKTTSCHSERREESQGFRISPRIATSDEAVISSETIEPAHKLKI